MAEAAKEKLFSEFPPVTTEEWMAKITADLKGVPFEKKLVWKTGDGFNVNPFYRAEDIEGLATATSLPGEFPYVRGTKVCNTWLVRQDLAVDDCAAANEKAKRLIAESGVTALGFNRRCEHRHVARRHRSGGCRTQFPHLQPSRDGSDQHPC